MTVRPSQSRGLHPALPFACEPKQPGCIRAFSLVELIVVIAIIVLIAGLAVPALNGIKGGNDLTTNAYRLQETLDQARTYAMARNSYVLVGITEQPPALGAPAILISVVATKDGTRNFTAANLTQVSRLIRLEDLKIAPASNPSPARPADDFDTAAASTTFKYPLSGTQKYTFDRAIEFSPEGMAYIHASTPTLARGGSVICVQPARQATSTNYAQLQIDALTGATSLDRP